MTGLPVQPGARVFGQTRGLIFVIRVDSKVVILFNKQLIMTININYEQGNRPGYCASADEVL